VTYAVIELSGSQFLVSEGDKLKVNRLSKDEGKTFSLVPLLLVSEGEVSIGQPSLEAAQVRLKILEHKKDKKIEVRRFRSKSRYRRKTGHRELISIVRVEKIITNEAGGLGSLGLSTRTENALKIAGIESVGELKEMSKEELLEIKGVGEKAAKEIITEINR